MEHDDYTGVIASDMKAIIARLTEDLAQARAEAAEWQHQAIYHNKKHGEAIEEKRAAAEAASILHDALRKVRDRNKAKRGYFDSVIQQICRDALKQVGPDIRALATEAETTALAEITRQAVDADRKQFDGYILHKRNCDMMSAFTEGKHCTCGLDAILARIDQRKEAGK